MLLIDTLTRTCRYCGCTDERACPGGCTWIAEEVCSAPDCAERWRAAERRRRRDLVRHRRPRR